MTEILSAGGRFLGKRRGTLGVKTSLLRVTRERDKGDDDGSFKGRMQCLNTGTAAYQSSLMVY